MPTVDAPPSGPFLSLDQGPRQARLYQNTGHVELAGPDLAGAAHASVVTFAPVAATVGGHALQLGKVRSSTAGPDRLEVVQELGGAAAATARVRLSWPQEGVLRYEVLDWGGPAPTLTTVTKLAAGGEHLYGLGEKFNALDQRGKKVHTLTFDQPGPKGDHSYKVAPWFVSTAGYGFHLDSTAESTFDLCAAAPDRCAVVNPAGALRFHVVHGPRLTDVVSRYTGLTGRPPLPPPWVFGPWISSDVWRNGGEVRYAVTTFHDRGLPASAFVFDSPWETAYNDFHFNLTQFAQGGTFEGKHFDGFASVAELMGFLRDHGLKVICWMTPFVNTQSTTGEVAGQKPGAANYQDGVAHGAFVRASPGGPPVVVTWWKGKGSPIDFTSAAGREWLTGQLKALLTASAVTTRDGGHEPAVGGFKTDDGESGNGPNTYIPPTAAYADGRTGKEMRNGYCLEYHRTVWGVLGAKGVLFARSGFTGSQAFPGCWAGDNEPNFGPNGLPSVIVAGLSAAASGFSIWGHDVGGYQNTHFSPVSPANLFMRWAQFGCFSPIMQMHRQVDGSNLRQYPWGYPEAGETLAANRALDNFRFYARLHTQLFPYLYTHAKRSAETGLPILRPLVLLHQDDPRTFPVEHTYYFGDDFLAAPAVEPGTVQRVVYLPRGTWHDFWTGARVAGGQDFTWESNDSSRFPLFVRAGAIVPMLLRDDVQTLCDANYVNNPNVRTADDGVRFLVYPSGASHFVIYDGTEVACQEAGAGRVVTLTSAPRAVACQVLQPEPAGVTRDGVALTRFATAAELEAALAGWWFDAAGGFLHVKFQHIGGQTRVEC
jgi:alpha-D-xyloside xylohydrolase